MRTLISILATTAVGSILLQGYFAIWHPSSFGRFAELPLLLLFAFGIATVTFLILIVPGFVRLKRTHRAISPPAGFLLGLFVGCIVMLLFMALWGWPMRAPELVAASIAGAVGLSIHARLVFKPTT